VAKHAVVQLDHPSSNGLLLRLAMRHYGVTEDVARGALSACKTVDVALWLVESGLLTQEAVDDCRQRLAAVVEPKTVLGMALHEKLGQGGMGRVFRAHQDALGRDVAVKVMIPQYALSRRYRQRFLTEARVLGQVLHSNVITTYDAGEDGDLLYLIMELMEGGDMKDLLQAQGVYSVDLALEIALGCARGLQAIFEAGLVHRDIKPRNIFLTKKNEPKIADLGLALQIETPEGKRRRVGTPAFMSPEQADGSVELDIRSDIHALGATLYNVLTGALPFSGSDQRELLRAIRKAQPVPLRQLRPELPEPVERLILWMLAKRPHDRPQTPEVLIGTLETMLGRGRGGDGKGTKSYSMSADEESSDNLLFNEDATSSGGGGREGSSFIDSVAPNDSLGFAPADVLAGKQVAVEQDLTGRQAYRCPKCDSIVEAYADLCQCGFDVPGWREEMQRRKERELIALAEAEELERRVAEEASQESEEYETNCRTFTTAFLRRRRKKPKE
jgi:serine/threonine protein kinase